MMRRSAETRRRSSTLAPKRVSDSAVKSAVKPGRASSAAPGSSSKSRLPRPSMAGARAGAGAASAGPRTQRSAAGPSARSRLTVGGPRLSAFTPQTARRATGAATASKAVSSRLSVDSQRRQSRGSGIGASRQRCPDPRLITDKAYWQPATHRVVQFLAERGYHENRARAPLTYKDLIKCTGRDFDDIFSFIYGCFSPTFTLAQKKREEEIPALMKMLNYPGLITKSHLITIGCAHSWPSIVAVLDWLADEVNLSLPAGESDPVLLMLPTLDNNGFPEIDRESCVMLEHNLETYHRWLANKEQSEDVEAEALRDALAALHPIDPAELRRLEAENEHLRQEAPDLSRLEQRLEELVQRRHTADTDARRLADHVAGRRQQQQERLKQKECLQKDVQERAKLMQLKRDQVDALRLELSQQELSADDVAKIAQQRMQLHKRIDGVKEEIGQLSTENGALEMELARAQSQQQAVVRSLNAGRAALAAALPSLDAAPLRLSGSEADQLGQLAEMERAEEGAERAARHQLELLQTTLLQQERNSREVRGQLEQARQEQFHVTSRLRRLEEEDAAYGQELQQRHATLDNQITEVESELTRLSQERQQQDVASLRSRLETDARQLKETEAEWERDLATRSQQVAEHAALALEFRRWMDDDTDQLTLHMAELCSEAEEKLRRTIQQRKQPQQEQQEQQQSQKQQQQQPQKQQQQQGREPLVEIQPPK